MPDEEISPAETARRMKTTVHNVYELLWANQLRGRRSDGRWLVSATAVAERIAKKQKKLERPRTSAQLRLSTRGAEPLHSAE